MMSRSSPLERVREYLFRSESSHATPALYSSSFTVVLTRFRFDDGASGEGPGSES